MSGWGNSCKLNEMLFLSNVIIFAVISLVLVSPVCAVMAGIMNIAYNKCLLND